MSITRTLGYVAAFTAAAISGGAVSQDVARQSMQETDPPFGGEANVAYAADLWAALEAARMVGPQSLRAVPYKGREPHGAVLVTLEGRLGVHGHDGIAIVKKNYLADGLTVAEVAAAPDENLASITVMYRRAGGYDPQNADWYWAKYASDGSLQENPKGMALAGRVAKGAERGCIACHAGAEGGDYVFNHDRLAE
jgi:hypothetical protein